MVDKSNGFTFSLLVVILINLQNCKTIRIKTLITCPMGRGKEWVVNIKQFI